MTLGLVSTQWRAHSEPSFRDAGAERFTVPTRDKETQLETSLEDPSGKEEAKHRCTQVQDQAETKAVTTWPNRLRGKNGVLGANEGPQEEVEPAGQ